jgi:hypothetical protein
MKLKASLIAGFIILCVSANAQFRLGLQASGLKLPKSTGDYGMSFGPGVDVAYSPDESKIEYYFSGSYFLPVSSVGYGLVYDNSSSSTTATLTQKTSLLALGLGARYYFIDRESDFNVYAAANVSYLMANTTATYSNVPAGYSPAYNDDAGGKSNQFMIGAGIGFEYKIGSGAIFADGHFRFPTSTYNSRTGYASDVEIPAHLGFSVGYRFSLGGGSDYGY